MLTAKDLEGKRVVLRADLDAPVSNGEVENTFRLEKLLPTIKLCQKYATSTLLIGHLGRPIGEDAFLSLAPVQKWLKMRLNQDISFVPSGFSPGEWWTGEFPLTILENLRFFPGEESQDIGFAKSLCTGADIYVYEAFAAYRPCASLFVIPKILPTFTGLQFDKEVEALEKVRSQPERPSLLIASGSKLDKLEIIKKISPFFDKVLLGGKLASPEHLTPDGLDLNEPAISYFQAEIAKARTIVLNGPLGLYEKGHAKATKAVLQALKDTSAFTLLGGGDTLAAIPSLGFAYTDYGFVSTGGGAMLEYLATGSHPLLSMLK